MKSAQSNTSDKNEQTGQVEFSINWLLHLFQQQLIIKWYES